MTWFAFQGLNGGKAIDLAGLQEKQAVGESFHGYATKAQAEAHPNTVNFITRTLADVWIADYHAAVKEGAQPGGPNNILTPGGLGKAVVQGSPLSGLAAIGDFFAKLGDPNLWIRVAKVVIGGTLLLIGLSHLTGVDNAVANTARKAPLPI